MATNYPQVTFHFTVEWQGARVGFTEVTGLKAENQVIEYREGDAKNYQVTKMPGIPKFGNITLKRGMLGGDNDFNTWLTTVKKNKIERRTLKVSLLDEEHNPVMTWQISDCWPVSLAWSDLKSTGNEVAIETLELATEEIKLLV